MSNKKNTHDGFESVEEALTKTEQYIEDNRKSLSIIVLAIAILFGGFYAYKNFIVQPKEVVAQESMFAAVNYFEKDSFLLALEGDLSAIGFLDIINDYGITKTANLAQYYAGISYLRLGEYESAIEHLEQYNPKDKIVGSIALGATGDAHSELEEYSKAVSYYEKAADYTPNDLTSAMYLKKAGLVLEEMGDFGKALKKYEKIKSDFQKSEEARDIDKYIAAAKAQL